MRDALHFVSQSCSKILDLVQEKKMSVDAAIELLDVMQTYGFVYEHYSFFDAVKKLVHKVATPSTDDDHNSNKDTEK